MRQINAGLRKEWMFFWRNFRFMGLVLLIFGLALFFPLMSGAINAAAAETEQMGIYMERIEGEEGLFTLYTMTVSYLFIAAFIIPLIIKGAAGKEQKKREIILPQTAGLTCRGYVLPKFMLYPFVVFALMLGAVFAANGVCHMIVGVSYSAEAVLISGSLISLFAAFSVCFYLFIGISTAQPGLAVVYVLGAHLVFGEVIDGFRIDRYTPWNLMDMSMSSALALTNRTNMLITAGITAGMCLLFMLLTLFAMAAKRMDNTANEVY
jgi:hypothetical protein